MNTPGQRERITQNRVVQLFRKELDYTYLGDWEERENNNNIEEDELIKYLLATGYPQTLINKALHELRTTATNFNDSLYTTNKNVYQLLRYGVKVKATASDNYETVQLINWKEPTKNNFAIAEEVTIKGDKTKRPDVVLYINGIALGVLELKRGINDVGEGIRQNITNQDDRFIQPFFATIQLVMAGNDTQGLRYGAIGTKAKWFLKWKEDIEDNSRNPLDKYLLKMCAKERFLELIYDFILFDGGIKKLPRVHQYFGIKAAQEYVNRYEGGIIWHTQGSGKSITMVLLAKWILQNNPKARVAILTDRTELDDQIEGVFQEAGEDIYRTSSGKDLMYQLTQAKPRLLCSLVHKFGKRSKENFGEFIKELLANPIPVMGEVFVFVDEAHRSQSGKLHRTMKAVLPNAVFIGFTGTPLLKKDKQTSLEVFGRYIHTYKFNEGVDDKVILDLIYEARDIDQKLSSPQKVDDWFLAKTKGLNDFQTAVLKKKWGTMQKVMSSKSRMSKIVTDIVLDFSTKPRISEEKGNAILVAHSIYEACEYYKLFQQTEFKGRCAVITSYNPNAGDVRTEDTGEHTETQKQAIYNLYEEILKDVKAHANKTKTETYEDISKSKFKKEPNNMKLLIVVSKLLTGFDAPSCSYLYIDKNMQDHGLFQAICRVNRKDTPDKDFGYIIDYRDLFEQVGDAVAVYTEDLATDDFDKKDIGILLKDRLSAGKERLDNALEELALLCEAVEPPKERMDYIRYFCGNTELTEDLKASEAQRMALYKKTVALIRAYANIADEITEAGYSKKEIIQIEKDVDFYLNLREEIKKASGETLDIKDYEADMRHLIDTYIQAEESEVISPFGDMPLLEIISKSGIADAIDSLPNGLKKNKEAVAETIENNVRKKIITDHLIDPAYFEKMSALLDALIKERKENAITYAEYLKRIGELANQVSNGQNVDSPQTLKTQGVRALFNNLNQNEKLALQLDEKIKIESPADWRGHTAKENVVRRSIYEVLTNNEDEINDESLVQDPPSDYGIKKLVEKIFNIVREQQEY